MNIPKEILEAANRNKEIILYKLVEEKRIKETDIRLFEFILEEYQIGTIEVTYENEESTTVTLYFYTTPQNLRIITFELL